MPRSSENRLPGPSGIARGPLRRGIFRFSAGRAAGQALFAGWVLPLIPFLSAAAAESRPLAAGENLFWREGNHAIVCSPRLAESLRILVVADLHLGILDERDEENRPNAQRMANPSLKPAETLSAALAKVAPDEFDFVALVGDILNFPSLAGVDEVRRRMADCAVPWRYVAGNHDWHFEGKPGSAEALRGAWIEKRLRPLYPADADPLMFSVKVKGVNLVFIDNSTYEILPKQLEFFRNEVLKNEPMALFVHIPLHSPGSPLPWDFECGHPDWGAAVDPYWEIERRERWPEAGCSETTMAFVREAFDAPNLLAVTAGHLHESRAYYGRDKAQWVAPATRSAENVFHLTLRPMPPRAQDPVK